MNNAIFSFREPQNEQVKSYAPGGEERRLLQAELDRQFNLKDLEIPLIIGGKRIKTGKIGKVVMPTNHGHVLATYHQCTEKEVRMAIDAAMKARNAWANLPWEERSSIVLRAAELFATKYRYVINAATMLGQAKNAMQAEIDSACETIDFLRFNPHFAGKIYADQPLSVGENINRLEYRPLEGFIYTITPFNFTAIAVNLNISPVLMGNVTVWKPATTSLLSSYYAMEIFMEAGIPAGVINFGPGSGSIISNVVLNDPDFGGIHFTGSTGVFNSFWKTVGENISKYKTYPKIVGETGGKDFIFAHNSAKPRELATALVRGSFEFQGQKCSASSRAYIPKSLWEETKKYMFDMIKDIKMGDVLDFSNFVNAVIDENSFDNIAAYIERAKKSNDAEIIIGGKCDKSKGYFIEPTVILAKTPKYETMEDELFGPVLTIYVYEDEKYEETLKLCDETSTYALTGSIIAHDRYAVMVANKALRYSAGNFYINDKCTGAVVGQQPFGGARASGTNDKAGSYLNLIRWTSPRTIKENINPPSDYKYPFLAK
jgi:1-pyrroline-5-carboxylate dehydrogenase